MTNLYGDRFTTIIIYIGRMIVLLSFIYLQTETYGQCFKMIKLKVKVGICDIFIKDFLHRGRVHETISQCHVDRYFCNYKV